MNDEAEVRELLRRVDTPVPLDAAARDRVEERMLARYAASTPVAAIDLHPVDGDRPDRDRRRGSNVPRLLIAAVALVVLGVVGVGLLRSGDDDVATVTTGPDIETDTRPPASLPANILGFEETTTYDYRSLSESPVRRLAGVAMRPGTYEAATGDLIVRRSVDVMPEAGTPQEGDDDVTLVFGADGTLFVPLEFLDPAAFGGRCTGGRVPVRVDVTEVAVVADCDGVPTEVIVTLAVGPTDALPLLAEPVEARPFTYRIAPAAGEPRIVSLWIADRGLVRISTDIGGTSAELDLAPDRLIAMGEGS